MGNVFAQEMQPFELGEQTASRLRRQLLQILLQGISRVVRPGHCRECLSTPLLGKITRWTLGRVLYSRLEEFEQCYLICFVAPVLVATRSTTYNVASMMGAA